MVTRLAATFEFHTLENHYERAHKHTYGRFKSR